MRFYTLIVIVYYLGVWYLFNSVLPLQSARIALWGFGIYEYDYVRVFWH
jgi:hypothetical protein